MVAAIVLIMTGDTGKEIVDILFQKNMHGLSVVFPEAL